MSASLDRAIEPLDAVRRAVWRAGLRVPALRGVLVRREARVPLLLLLHATAAFAVAVLAPAWALVLSPLVLGVPHLAADVRYLVLRRGVPRAWCIAIAGFACALIGLRATYEAGVLSAEPMRAEHALGSSWLLLALLAGASTQPLRLRCGLVGAAVLGVSFVALAFPVPFRHALVHAHNLVALAVWLVLFRRNARLAWVAVAVVLAAALLLASGLLLPVTLRHGLLSVSGLHLFQAADWLAPGVADVRAISITIAFAFLQSVHYAIWLVAIPQDDCRAAAAPTFRMKARGLARDFGRTGLGLALAAALLVGAFGANAPLRTRDVYLSLATFHNWLELAMLVFFLTRPPPR